MDDTANAVEAQQGCVTPAPVYLVTGFMRCGTSMMMKSLEAGGLEACYRPQRDELIKQHADEHYSPNAGGLYELSQRDYRHPMFPRRYAGKLIKGLFGVLAKMRVMDHGYKVVYMRRDPEEIRQSYVGFFGPETEMTIRQIENAFQFASETLANRRDVEFCEAWYRSVIDSPLAAFDRIKQVLDLPIDVAKAAAVVDPDLCHFKREELTVGV